MPIYEFFCENCEFEWDDIWGLHDPLPESCPECKEQGKIKKVISLPAHGKVELTGFELKAKVKEDTQKLKKEAYSKESVYSNLLGESKYQELQTKIDKQKGDLKNI